MLFENKRKSLLDLEPVIDLGIKRELWQTNLNLLTLQQNPQNSKELSKFETLQIPILKFTKGCFFQLPRL